MMQNFNIVCTLRDAKFNLSNQPYMHGNVHTIETQSTCFGPQEVRDCVSIVCMFQCM